MDGSLCVQPWCIWLEFIVEKRVLSVCEANFVFKYVILGRRYGLSYFNLVVGNLVKHYKQMTDFDFVFETNLTRIGCFSASKNDSKVCTFNFCSLYLFQSKYSSHFALTMMILVMFCLFSLFWVSLLETGVGFEHVWRSNFEFTSWVHRGSSEVVWRLFC